MGFIHHVSLPCFLVSGLLIACSEQGGSSSPAKPRAATDKPAAACLALINGVVSTDHPEVAQIKTAKLGATEACTGTFVGPNVLITAAHCVDGTPGGGVSLVVPDGEPVAATHVFTRGTGSGGVEPSEAEVIAADIAVVQFASSVAKASVRVAAAHPPEGATVTLVGYGATTAESTALDNQQRAGTQLIRADQSYAAAGVVDLIRIPADEAAPGEMAMIASGDSGGPLLYLGELVAVASSFSPDAVAELDGKEVAIQIGHFADLTTEASQALLARAIAGGADVRVVAKTDESDAAPASATDPDTGTDEDSDSDGKSKANDCTKETAP